MTQRASILMRRLGAAALALVCALTLLAAAAYWGLPHLVRSQLPVVLGEALGRPVTVGEVAFNPFTLRIALADLAIGEAGGAGPGAAPPLRVAGIAAQASWRSILDAAPVVADLQVRGLRAQLAREADGRLSIDDVLARLGSRPARPPGPPPRFVLTGVSVVDAEFDFDDRLAGRAHRITGVGLTLPRVSSLASDRQQPTEPVLGLAIDGVPLRVTGSVLPFAPTPSASLDIDLAPLPLAGYRGYLPPGLPLELREASASARLRVDVALAADAPPALSVSGDVTLAGVDLRAPGGAELLVLDALRVRGLAAQPLAGRIDIGALEIDAPRVAVVRRADEPRFFEAVLRALPGQAAAAAPRAAPSAGSPSPGASAAPAMPAPSSAAPTPSAAASPLRWSVGEVVLRDGRVDLRDERFSPQPLALRLESLALKLGRLSSEPASTPFELGFAADGGGRFDAHGSVRPQPLAVDAEVTIDAVPLRRWWWIAAPEVQADLVDGVFGLKTRVRLDDEGAGPALRLSELSAHLSSLALRQRWNGRELLTLPSVKLAGSSVDVPARRIALGSLELAGGSVVLLRDRDGQLNLARAFAPAPGPAATPAKAVPATAPSAQAAASRPPATKAARQGATRPSSRVAAKAAPMPAAGAAPPWRVSLERFALSGASARFRQAGAGARGTAASSEASLRDLSLRLDGLSDEPGRRARLALRARVGDAGRLEAAGTLGLAPVAAQLRIDARAIGLLPARPFVAERLRMDLTAGALSARGDLALELPSGAQPRVAWKGDLHVADFNALTAAGEELLRWRSLSVDGVDATVAPLSVTIAQVALADFYSRLIINPQGRFNLQELATDDETESSPAGAPTVAPAAASDPPAAPPGARPGAAPKAALPVRVGRISLVNGNIDFTDRFIRPNYSANLTGMTGSVSAIGPDTPGELVLRGRIDNAGSVEIAGTINPFAPTLQLDLRAQARDIDLPRTTPYAVKYLGYGIEKGKLSVRLQYRIVGRQLEADNEITLDQLTFGERIDSPTATQLPVLFAVSLLKDRHGVIDVKLPISGSLDDPQFSISGLVLRIVFNLIAKAVAAPFSLLANLFGGGDGEISQIDFEAGRAVLGEAAGERLATLARALADRPALRLDLAGRTDPATDEAALRRLGFERRLKTAKLRLAGAPVPAAGLDAVGVDEAERPRLLLAAWRAGAFPKPRDDQGRVREQPPEVMERMLLDDITIDGSALLALADARAQAAKEWLIGRGIDGERLFVVAPKMGGDGAAARVDLTLR